MDLVASATERATAATDLLLAVATLGGAAYLGTSGRPTTARLIWVAALAAGGLASLLGSITHGLVMSEGLREALWQPLFLLLGVVVACFVGGAVGDAAGPRAARRLLPLLLLLAVVFYGLTRLAGGNFLVFVLFQAGGLLVALAVYLRLARRGRAGAGLVAAALATSLAAGGIQAQESLAVTLVWEFDHNGLYHLAQLAGLALLVAGLRRTLPAAPTDAA
jgi:hypothetical protein